MIPFNAEMEVNKIVRFVRDYYKENNLGGAVIGISGGKDSAVTAALMVRALGKENVLGVTLPCYSKIKDKIDAQIISDYYGFSLINFELTNVYDSFKNELSNLGSFKDNELNNSDINLKPRLRMATLYYLAAMYSSIKNKIYLVVGTSNKSELFVGYFTKGGDNIHDISLLADFTVDEVIKLGEYLNVPKEVLYKKPDDGLSNQKDEEKLGVNYSDIAKYIENKEYVTKEVRDKIEKLHEMSRHKFYISSYQRNGDYLK